MHATQSDPGLETAFTRAKAVAIQSIPDDNVLPGLPLALDTSRMREILHNALFATYESKRRFSVETCEIFHVRYKPGKYCAIGYRLAILDRNISVTGEQVLSARVFGRGGSHSRYFKAQAADVTTPRFGEGLIHIPELDMVVWAFPNDRKLHTLAAALDPQHLHQDIVPRIIGQERVITNLKQEVVRYVGEHTCTQRLTAQFAKTASAEVPARVVYSKTYYDDSGADTWQIMRRLWRSKARHQGELAMPEPLWYDAERKTLWQEGLPGVALHAYDLRSPEMMSLLARAGTAAAGLHRAGVTGNGKVTGEAIIARLAGLKTFLAGARPRSTGAADEVINRLIAGHAQLSMQPTATLHADLHLKNFIVHAGAVALIDFDNLCSGPPLCDIGSFVASLYYRGLVSTIATDTIAELVTAFVCGYEQRVPWKVSRSDLAWHVAAALMTERAFRGVTRFKIARHAVLDELIELANEISLGRR